MTAAVWASSADVPSPAPHLPVPPERPADALLDGLLRCASRLLDRPLAQVALLADGQRLQTVAAFGPGLGHRTLPLAQTFCARTLRGDSVFEVEDARADDRFAALPLVRGEPAVRAYAGVALVVDGQRVGTLAVFDRRPRRLDGEQAARLAELGGTVAACFAQRRAQQALLDGLAAQAPGLLLQYEADGVDGGGRFSYLGPQLQSLFGLEPAALHAGLQPLLDQVHPEDRDALRSALQTAATQRVTLRQAFRIERPGQGPRWCMLHAAPAPAADGVPRCDAFVADSAGGDELERLRRQALEAERASAGKSAFLSRVSHELRTPLNAMMGFTQLLQIDAREPLSPVQRERVDHVLNASRLLLGVIDDLLDLGRIEQGARPLVPGPVALPALLNDCLPMVARMAEQADVGLRPELGGAAGLYAAADRRALEQVLLNLLSNGIKYNRRGGTLRIALGGDAQRVRIAVRDEGAGLDAAQQARLFQPFDRLGAEHSQVEGSGLGLLITRQLVEAMGGTLAVDSAPGRGSAFTVELPRWLGEAAAPPPAAPAGPPEAAVQSALTVLCIEDDPVNMVLVQQALQCRPGWRLLHAADGRSGLALAQALQPDLVLSDINLPGLDGQAIVRALRADPLIGRTVCIALSADAMSGQVADAMAAGFDDYWTKPVDVATLALRIESWLAPGGTARSARVHP